MVIVAGVIGVPLAFYLVGFTPAGVAACRFSRFHWFLKSPFFILTLRKPQ